MRLEPKATGIVPFRNATFLGYAYFTAGRYDDAIAALNPHCATYVRRAAPGLAILAAAYATTGQDETARGAMKAFLDKKPRSTLSNYRSSRRYKRKEDMDRTLDLLRKAGIARVTRRGRRDLAMVGVANGYVALWIFASARRGSCPLWL